MAGLTQPPHRFTGEITWEDSKPLLNDNLEKIVSSTNDLGARFTNTGYQAYPSLASNSFVTFVQDVTTSLPEYRFGFVQIVPRIAVYIDVDNDEDYRWPLGTAVSSVAPNFKADISPAIYPATWSDPATVAMYHFTIHNYDASAHNIYVYHDVSYMNSPSSGQFR